MGNTPAPGAPGEQGKPNEAPHKQSKTAIDKLAALKEGICAILALTIIIIT